MQKNFYMIDNQGKNIYALLYIKLVLHPKYHEYK